MSNQEYKDKNIYLFVKNGDIWQNSDGKLVLLTMGKKIECLLKLMESKTRIYFRSKMDYFYYDKEQKVIIFFDKEITDLFINNGIVGKRR